MSITITVPNDDHVALRAMAKALEEIAVARGAPSKSEQIGELNYTLNIDTTVQQFESLGVADGLLNQLVKTESDNNGQQNKGYVQTEEGQFDLSTGAQADATGAPWDERIHSASKALNADGTWRLRRKPKDMDETEWSEYIDTVLVEIKPATTPAGKDIENLMLQMKESESPEQFLERYSEAGAISDEYEPSVTTEGDDFHVDTGVVTEQQVVSFPPPPPVPVVAPPVVEEKTAAFGYEYSHMTFPQVMAFLTERHGRISNAQVEQIIAEMGLKSIMDLNTQPEHTGPFIARVKALLGE